MKFELEADVRKDVGKGASRRLRHTDKVPAVVYGAGEPAVSITLEHNKVFTAFKNEAFYSSILSLNIEKKKERVVLKAVQRNPAKPRISHIDFLRVRADQKLQMNIPIHFVGEEQAPGLKEGGVISHILSDIEVSCLPDDLPEFIEVDLSGLNLNDSVHLSQIVLPKGVELVAFIHGEEHEHDEAIASLHIPRIIEEEVPVEAAAVSAEVPATEQTSEEGTATGTEEKKD